MIREEHSRDWEQQLQKHGRLVFYSGFQGHSIICVLCDDYKGCQKDLDLIVGLITTM